MVAPLSIARIAIPPAPAPLPTTHFVTRPWNISTSKPPAPKPIFSEIWLDRSTTGWADKPNEVVPGGLKVNGLPCAPTYSSVKLACGAFLSRWAFDCGYPKRNDPRTESIVTMLRAYKIIGIAAYGKGMGYLDIADAFGFDTAPHNADNVDIGCNIDTRSKTGKPSAIHYASLADRAPALFRTHLKINDTFEYMVAQDLLIYQQKRLTDLPKEFWGGQFADAEADDDRGEMLFSMCVKVACLLSQKAGLQRPMWSMDPLTGAGKHLGATKNNLNDLQPYVLWFNLQTTQVQGVSAKQSLDDQLAMYRGANGKMPPDMTRLAVQVNVGTSDPAHNNLADKQYIKDFCTYARAKGIRWLFFTNTYGDPTSAEYQAVYKVAVDAMA